MSTPAVTAPPKSQAATRRARRTVIATKGTALVRAFEASECDQEVAGYQPTLSEPAQSTQGGHAALQHIVLRAQDARAAKLTVGSVNCVTLTAKLRTFRCVDDICLRRFGRALTIPVASYEAFVDQLQAFFGGHGFRIELVDDVPDVQSLGAPSLQAEPARPAPRWVWILAVVVFVLIFVGLIRLLV